MNDDELLRIELLADDLVLVLDLARDERPLVHRRQKRVVPQRRPHRRRRLRAEDDVAGQVVVDRAEAVGEPGADRRTADLRVPGVHHQHRRLVVRDVGVHRADEADVVGAAADVREQLADVHAALAVLLERERRTHQRAGLPLGRHRSAGQRLAVVLVEHRLGIEAVHLREPAVHEQEDDVLRLRRVMQPAVGERRLLAPRARVAMSSDSPSMPANASMPKPLPMRHSASRRVTGAG